MECDCTILSSFSGKAPNLRLLHAQVAETHPPEYSVHKYWARKPANVLASHLRTLLPMPGLVVDPFCGSGVLLKEAANLGHEVVGADVNPVAVHLSRFSLEPPTAQAYINAADEILRGLTAAVQDRYDCSRSEYGAFRYAVHAIIVECPHCGAEVSAAVAEKSGKTYKCPSCSGRLRFNRRLMIGTKIIESSTQTGPIHDPAELEHQERLSRTPVSGVDSAPFDKAFVHNGRTLTYAGMTTAHLFTERNMSTLSLFAESISSIADPRVRRALELTLTSSVASSSRLIAYRNGMSGGGPAWSVPGYWVPPIHLESNPLNHWRARTKKFAKAIHALESRPAASKPAADLIRIEDAATTLARVANDRKADVIFLDPPYGDSVPYLEFSALWNSFLRSSPSPTADISVSDRKSDNGSWHFYESKLKEILREAERALAENGRILVTFNNNDRRAWTALIEALQFAGFTCVDVTYQTPAVIPAKAQFSMAGSYVGDLYSVFERGRPSGVTILTAKDEIYARLRVCVSARDGIIARNLASRTIIIELMKLNADARMLDAVDGWIDEWFSVDGDRLRWRGSLAEDIEPLHAAVARETLRRMAGSSHITWTELAPKLTELLEPYGVPDATELRMLLAHTFDVTPKGVRVRPPSETALFSIEI